MLLCNHLKALAGHRRISAIVALLRTFLLFFTFLHIPNHSGKCDEAWKAIVKASIEQNNKKLSGTKKQRGYYYNTIITTSIRYCST